MGAAIMANEQLLALLEEKYQLPSGLLPAVMQTESGGNVNAVSPKGAEGAFQFMPATAKQYGVNTRDLASSAEGAAKMYADLLKAHNGDLDKALASYNFGQGNVAKYGMGRLPKETRDYIVKVKSNMPDINGRFELIDDEPVKEEITSDGRFELIDDNQVKTTQTKKPYSDNPLNAAFYNDMSFENVPQNAANLAAGAIRGAGSIGSTLIAPYDIAKDAINGKGLTLESNINRRNAIDEGLRTLGANPESGLYQAGKFGSEVAGTAGVGDALAAGAMAAKYPLLANALKSGGLNIGGTTGSGFVSGIKDLGIKMAGGGLTNGAAAGLINPESAPTGLALGVAIPFGQEAIKAGGKTAANIIGGLGTHTGGESIKQATRAGFEGGDRLKTVIDNMHGNVPMTDVLDDVQSNLQKMGTQKSELYRSGMIDISKDKTILSFDNVDNSINRAVNSVTYKGKITNDAAYKKLNEVNEVINDWKAAPANEFHTPEGMDKLKQKVGAILEDIPYEQSSARRVIGDIYHSIKNDISKQAPTYAKVMKDYGDATEQIAEIKRALIGGKKNPATDTAMRKLQSIMRNNVNSNFGNRLDLAKKMTESGGVDILPALAGQSLNTWTPRGIGGAVAGGLGGGAYYLAGLPSALATLAVQSPRLMGYGALSAGTMARGVNESAKLAIPAVGTLADYIHSK